MMLLTFLPPHFLSLTKSKCSFHSVQFTCFQALLCNPIFEKSLVKPRQEISFVYDKAVSTAKFYTEWNTHLLQNEEEHIIFHLALQIHFACTLVKAPFLRRRGGISPCNSALAWWGWAVGALGAVITHSASLGTRPPRLH